MPTPLSDNDAVNEWELLHAANHGDQNAWNQVVQRHREKLRRMVEFRMHPQLKRRIDASDVIQDTFVEAARVLTKEKENSDIPVHVWLRRLANQKLIQAHREHLGAVCRAADRERPQATQDQASSYSIAKFLIGDVTSPSIAAIRHEKNELLEQALQQMDALDREVLVLRHFEHLSGPETAEVLSISHDAVKKRYIRALEKLQRIMVELGISD